MKKDCFYRISVKGLIEDKEGKFLLVREGDGTWELPGGGLEHGENPRDALIREIKEEMGLDVLSFEETPAYFTATLHRKGEYWISNVIYRVSLKHLDFTPSEECLEYRFFTKRDAAKEKLFPNVVAFLEQYPDE